MSSSTQRREARPFAALVVTIFLAAALILWLSGMMGYETRFTPEGNVETGPPPGAPPYGAAGR